MQLSWQVKRAKPLIDSHQNLNQLKVDERAWEGMRVDESFLRPDQTRTRVDESATLALVWSPTLINSHPCTLINFELVQILGLIKRGWEWMRVATLALVWPPTLNSRALSSTLMHSHQLWGWFKFWWESMRVLAHLTGHESWTRVVESCRSKRFPSHYP